MSKTPLSSQILSDIEFELEFYSCIAESKEFDIIPIPLEDGHILSSEEYNELVEEATKNGIKVLVRISNGETAVVLNPLTGKTGIVPENNAGGFLC